MHQGAGLGAAAVSRTNSQTCRLYSCLSPPRREYGAEHSKWFITGCLHIRGQLEIVHQHSACIAGKIPHVLYQASKPEVLKRVAALTVGRQKAQLAHAVLQVIPEDHYLLRRTF